MSYVTTGGTTASNSTVSAFFDSRAEAEAAVARIVEVGVSRTAIKMVEGAHSSASPEGATGNSEDRSFFQALGDFLMPEEDRHTFAEGLRRGGYLVSVPTNSTNYDDILDILDDEGTVDMDERESTWKSEGWDGRETGYASPTPHGERTSGTADPFTLGEGTMTTAAPPAGTFNERAADATTDRSATAAHDGTIEVVEETLRVGKRDVSHGRVRVRSYVVEEQAEADVSLHSDRVEIERRAVDRPVTGGVEAFQDRTLELEETSQEAVASKEARVKEEIDLNRLSDDRTETVSETVRRTEVEVEDDRNDSVNGVTSSAARGDKRRID